MRNARRCLSSSLDVQRADGVQQQARRPVGVADVSVDRRAHGASLRARAAPARLLHRVPDAAPPHAPGDRLDDPSEERRKRPAEADGLHHHPDAAVAGDVTASSRPRATGTRCRAPRAADVRSSRRRSPPRESPRTTSRRRRAARRRAPSGCASARRAWRSGRRPDAFIRNSTLSASPAGGTPARAAPAGDLRIVGVGLRKSNHAVERHAGQEAPRASGAGGCRRSTGCRRRSRAAPRRGWRARRRAPYGCRARRWRAPRRPARAASKWALVSPDRRVSEVGGRRPRRRQPEDERNRQASPHPS